MKTASFLNREEKQILVFYSFTINCFNMKLLINNNITRNRNLPIGAHCER